jgi:hypothetical protein
MYAPGLVFRLPGPSARRSVRQGLQEPGLSPLAQASSPQLSPNGEFYWSGTAWVSLLSEDGTQRWDGKQWVPRNLQPAQVAPAPAPASELAPSDRPSWLAAGVSMPESVSRDIPVPAAVAVPVAAVPIASPPAGSPAPIGPTPAPGRPMRKTWIAGGAIAFVALMALAAYGAIQVIHPYAYIKVTGANSVAEFAAEQKYDAVYSHDAAKIQVDSQPYNATSTSPGVCNKGGTAQACYETDQKLIGDFRLMMTDLGRLTPPPRFKQADSDLRAGLQLSIDGIGLRDQAIASNDPNASFAASNQQLQEALTALHLANKEFPADNAPQPKF